MRSKLFDVLLAFWTALFGLAVPVLWLCGSPKPAIRAATRLWVNGALLGLKHVMGLRHVELGREHIPNKPCLIVANHQSTWETLASLLLFPDVAIVAKQELLAIPVFGWYLRHSPMIVIDRETGPKALREMVKQSQIALSEGRSVLVFPEGTRRPVTDPVTFKRGAELLYVKLGVPVLTMALNSGHFWSPGDNCKRSGTITVSYGESLFPLGCRVPNSPGELRGSWKPTKAASPAETAESLQIPSSEIVVAVGRLYVCGGLVSVVQRGIGRVLLAVQDARHIAGTKC
jgi:1-acyl-sn-glycerol-3-phosphate acyltransferase